MLMVVVLPAPFGPSRAKTVPAGTVEVEPREHLGAPEALAESACVDGELSWPAPFRSIRLRMSQTVYVMHCCLSNTQF